MCYASPDGRYGLEISADLVHELVALCQEGRDCETGGILVGYYTSRRDVAIVTDVLAAPQDSVRYRSRFSTWRERSCSSADQPVEKTR